MGLIQTLLSEGYRAYQDKKSPAGAVTAGTSSTAAGQAAKTASGSATGAEGLQRSEDSGRSAIPGRYLRVTLQQASADIAPETFCHSEPVAAKVV